MIRCYVINLDEDTARWTDVAARLNCFPAVAYTRVSGIPGGTIGCTKAHLAVWREIAAADDPWALVLEDDSCPHSLDQLGPGFRPDPYDLVFCNDRMCPIINCDPGQIFALGPSLPWNSAVGTDGYIVTREAAKKLVMLFTRDGLGSHVDLRLYAYGSKPSFPGVAQKNPHFCAVRRLPTNELKMGRLSLPLTNHDNSAPSSIRKIFS